jgi:hypothetical protein
MKRFLVAAFMAAVLVLGVGLSVASGRSHQVSPGCNTPECAKTQCAKSRECQQRVWRKHHPRAAEAQNTGYAALSPADKAWAYSTAVCESGHNPPQNVRTGNGFVGMFQWVTSTWTAAGGTGSPMNASFQTQAVIAVRWHHSHPTGQWPVCGE